MKRIRVNCKPIDETSNNNKGILMLVQEQIKIRTFDNLLPFFKSIPATGNKAYSGTAVTTPKKKDTKIPAAPDCSPIILCMASFFTQTSSKPIQMKTGVNISKKFINIFPVKAKDLIPVFGTNRRTRTLSDIMERKKPNFLINDLMKEILL